MELRKVAYSGHILYLLPLFGIRKGARQPIGPWNEIKEASFPLCFFELAFGAAGLKDPKTIRRFSKYYIRDTMRL